MASGGCGTVMMCTKRDDKERKQYVLKYMNLDELTTNKANGAQREAEERVILLVITIKNFTIRNLKITPEIVDARS